MPVIVVGGHSRKVGKTSVACGLIRSLPGLNWTAMKVTQDHPNGGADHVPAAMPVPGIESARLFEETDPRGSGDTARFLAAGARRSLWIRTGDGCLGAAAPIVMEAAMGGNPVLVEGTGIVRLLQPDLFVMVLRYDVADFKRSARESIPLVSCWVVVGSPAAGPPWAGFDPALLDAKPMFHVSAGSFTSAALSEFVAGMAGGRR